MAITITAKFQKAEQLQKSNNQLATMIMMMKTSTVVALPVLWHSKQRKG